MAFLPSPQNISSQGASGGVTNHVWQGPGDGWFVWTCPKTDAYFFSTRGSGTDFKTTVTAYAVVNWPPMTIADYSAVTPIHSGDFGGEYGYEFGALTAFAATAGTEYLVNVGSRDGTKGVFSLEFGGYIPESLGDCSHCSPVSTGLCLITSAAVDDVSGTIHQFGNPNPAPNFGPIPLGWFGDCSKSSKKSLGNFLPGNYVLTYCSGALRMALLAERNYGSDKYIIGYFPLVGEFFSNGTSLGVLGLTPGASFSGSWVTANLFGSLADAEAAAQCLHIRFCHQGGEIYFIQPFPCTYISDINEPQYPFYSASVRYFFSCTNLPTGSLASAPIPPAQDWEIVPFEMTQYFFLDEPTNNYLVAVPYQNSERQPTAALLFFDLQQIVKLSVHSISNAGYTNGTDRSGGFKYSVTLSVYNSNLNYSTGNFSLRMLAQDGNTVTSTATLALNVAAASSDTSTATWTFYSFAADVLPATFRIYDCAGNFVCDVPLVLAEASAALHLNTTGNCDVHTFPPVPLSPSSSSVTVTNTGVVPVTDMVLQMQSPVGGQIMFSDPANGSPCAGPFSVTLFSKQFGYMEPYLTGAGANASAQQTVGFAMRRADVTLGVSEQPYNPNFFMQLQFVLADKAAQYQMPVLTQTVSLA